MPKFPERFEREGSEIKIKLASGDIAIIDFEDLDKVKNYTWWTLRKTNVKYAAADYRDNEGNPQRITLHRLLMNPEIDELVDHIDGDGLNNKKSNLRLCTKSQNGINRSKMEAGSSRYIGVSWDRYNNKWRADIRHKGKSYNLGRFSDETQAAKARDKAAYKYFGEFATLNFSEEGDNE